MGTARRLLGAARDGIPSLVRPFNLCGSHSPQVLFIVRACKVTNNSENYKYLLLFLFVSFEWLARHHLYDVSVSAINLPTV